MGANHELKQRKQTKRLNKLQACIFGVLLCRSICFLTKTNQRINAYFNLWIAQCTHVFVSTFWVLSFFSNVYKQQQLWKWIHLHNCYTDLMPDALPEWLPLVLSSLLKIGGLRRWVDTSALLSSCLLNIFRSWQAPVLASFVIILLQFWLYVSSHCARADDEPSYYF